MRQGEARGGMGRQGEAKIGKGAMGTIASYLLSHPRETVGVICEYLTYLRGSVVRCVDRGSLFSITLLNHTQNRTVRTHNMVTRAVYAILILVGLLAAAHPVEAGARITFNNYRRFYEKSKLKKLQYGRAEEFTFGRYQSPDAINEAMSGCRSPSSFKHHSAIDGRDGFYCSTRLGGEWTHLKLLYQP